jgi:DNA-binding transcriptional MerR regulator
MREALLDIGEIRRRSGLAASALRFYEAQGLIRSIGRRGLRRLYEASALDRLAFIALARASGFSIAEIKGLFAPRGTEADLRLRMAAKADEIEGRIAQLSSMRDRLRGAAACSCNRLVDCPVFMGLLKSALPFEKNSTFRCEAG